MEAESITLQHTVAIITVGFVVLGVVAAVTLPVRRNMDARPLGDPMVSSHIFALIPLAFAVHNRMWIAASVIVASTIASVVYHMARERPGSGLQILDTTLAYAFALFVGGLAILLLVSGTVKAAGTLPLLLTGLAAGAMGTVLLWLPDMVRTKDPCYAERVHPLWHLLAFAAASMVMWAAGITKEGLMTGSLVKAPASSSFLEDAQPFKVPLLRAWMM